MELAKITRKVNYYQVLFTDGTSIKMAEDVIIKYGLLKPKKVIDDETYERIIFDNDYYLALNDGLKYLSCNHSRKEVKEKLKKKYQDEIVMLAVEKLSSMNLINDLQYALDTVAYAKKALKGTVYVMAELEYQEIEHEAIEKALTKYTEKEELEACKDAFVKHLSNIKKATKLQAVNKSKNFLTSRGFLEDVIGITLDKYSYLIDNQVDEDKLIKDAFEKAFNKYSKKYKGKELNDRVTRNLLSKGFKMSAIKNILEKR